jgi:D-cysteine desulfhydrase
MRIDPLMTSRYKSIDPDDKLTFATLPTPLHPLPRLSETLGVEVWIKRDDLTGFAMGGNKVRKAEYLLADAKALGADTILTAGAVQSNHARVVAAAARSVGMECILFLSGQKPERFTGNLLLDHLADAHIEYVASPAERPAAMQAMADRLRAEGRIPYVIPIGGSNAVGALGYVFGYRELAEQVRALPPCPTYLVFASSSGGTYAGLLAGTALAGPIIDLLGIRVDDEPNPEQAICSVANEIATGLWLNRVFDVKDVHLEASFVGAGYGIPTEAGREAQKLLWQQEGILLDLVYTAKAMAGLIELARKGAFAGRRVLFLHTGGAPGVFS